MGISDSFGSAFAKAQLAASNGLPLEGAMLITVNDSDKPTVTPIARRFHEMGFKLFATAGTAAYLRARGIPASAVFKVHEGRPNCLDMIVNGDVQLLDQHAARQARAARRLHAAPGGDRATASRTRRRCRRRARRATRSSRCESRQPTVRSLQEWQAGHLDATRQSTRERASTDAFVHESAYVDDGATIGAGTKVWHFCHVHAAAR